MWFATFAADVTLIVLVALAVQRASVRHGTRNAVATAAGLALWLALVTGLAGAGLLLGVPTRPPRIAPAVALPILAGGLALLVSGAARAFVARVPQPWLVGIQGLRVLGVIFLVAWRRGVLPAHFALPAGLGDIAIGLAALLLARRLAPRLTLAFNVLGLLDLALAVSLGALTARSAAQVFFTTPSTDAMARLPLATIPTFGVPLFVLLHLASLVALRSERRVAPAGAPLAAG
jgi:hypothetical protein